MPFSTSTVQQSSESLLHALVEEFFRKSEGEWRSERRYYTLKEGDVQEVESLLTIHFLEKGSADLVELARMHELSDVTALVCGVQTSWESTYRGPSQKQLTGSTVFGVLGGTLYRDRGFATTKPVTAQFSFPDPKTMHLKTEYGGSTFSEEIKLIGLNADFRTRQTIISRAGEEQMIGQYFEKRI
jgi:CpeS-like protein